MIHRFARPYAAALLKIAGSTEAAVAVRDQVRGFVEAMDAEPALAKMAANPAVPQEAKRRVVRAIGARLGFDDLTFRLVELLLSNYRLQYLPAVLAALEAEVNRRLGVAVAEVATAQTLDDDEVSRLRDALSKMLDRRVDMKLSVDPALIAGFRARVGSTLYDASLAGQLDRLAAKLADASA